MCLYKLIHVHTDVKFLQDVSKYEVIHLHNEIVFLGDLTCQAENALNKLGVRYHVFPQEPSSFPKALSIITQADGVVLIGLCPLKEGLLRVIPKGTVKVFLRFFGFELYGQIPNKYLSALTMKAIYPIAFTLPIKRLVKNIVKRVLLKVEPCLVPNKQNKLYKKIDAILLFSEEEREELIKFFYLPPVILLPFNDQLYGEGGSSLKKEKLIVVGNSKGTWNNHLDVLVKLNQLDVKHNYNFFMFFSYGTKGPYATTVRDVAMSMDNLHLQEDFMNSDEFYNVYRKACALVINSYRQHALANIFTAIQYGCKIYLNNQSSTYKWLKNFGFVVAGIEDLPKDIINDNGFLSLEEQNYNIEKFMELKKSRTSSQFVKDIGAVIEGEYRLR